MTLLARVYRLTVLIQEHPEAARAYHVLYGDAELKQLEQEMTLPAIVGLVTKLEAIELLTARTQRGEMN